MNEKRYPVHLSPEERQALQHLIHTGKATAHQQMAARVLLKADEANEEHLSSSQIAEAGTGIKNIVNEACSLTLRLASWPIEPASGWHHWISDCKLHLVSAVQLDELLSSCVDPWEKGRAQLRLTPSGLRLYHVSSY